MAQTDRPATGLVICVAPGGTHAKMELTPGLTGLQERFAGRIYSAEDVPRSKPRPDLFLHAAKAMGVHHVEGLYKVCVHSRA